jgi:hypothetical protein
VGGFGSGRYGFSSAGRCESRHSIDLASLRRRGIVDPGGIGGRTTLACSLGGEKSGSIGVLAQADGLRLMYGVTAHDGTKISVDELVPFAYTATRFGGRRQWLTCIKCGWYCRKIYGGRYFRCRQCHRLKYSSQNENSAQRAMLRADRIANRLHDMWGGTTKGKYEFPPKPKRMRWATYQRLLDQYDQLQNRWGIGMMSLSFVARFSRFRPR